MIFQWKQKVLGEALKLMELVFLVPHLATEKIKEIKPQKVETRGNDDSNDDGDLELFSLVAKAMNTLKANKQKIPLNISRLQGCDWVSELIHGHDVRLFLVSCMSKSCYFALHDFFITRNLLPSLPQSRVSVSESIAIFMQVVCLHHLHRDEGERFQHSTETIHCHFTNVVNALNSVAREFINPPNLKIVHDHILNSIDFYPFFEGFIGAMDGTLIPPNVPYNKWTTYRSRKVKTSQNVLAICEFDCMFTYIYGGFEGYANDEGCYQTLYPTEDLKALQMMQYVRISHENIAAIC